jgi:hypothetical protein
MSLAACQWVWDECPAKNGERLVLLALAVFADDNGRCFCPVEVLMAKTRMCKRNVGRAVDRCVEAGWLEVEQEARWQNGVKMARDFRVKMGGNLSTKLGDNLSEMGGNLSKLGDNLSEMGDKLPPQNNKKNQNNQNTGADAPAPATASPSLPSSSVATVAPPKPPRPPKPKAAPADLSSLSLPHAAGFHKWWSHFVEHRAAPIKGRLNPLTVRAAEIILGQLAAVNEEQAVEAIKDCIASGWVKPYPPKTADTPKVLHTPRTGPVQPSEAEKRMMALEALQADRMKGAA